MNRTTDRYHRGGKKQEEDHRRPGKRSRAKAYAAIALQRSAEHAKAKDDAIGKGT